MSVPTYRQLAPGYQRLWDALVPTQMHLPALQEICRKLVMHKAQYAAVARATWNEEALWWIVALIDQMEGGGGARTHLANGDSLNDYTRNVPAGQPNDLGHGPPFSFLEAAVWALHHDGLDRVTSWPITMVAYRFEAYNGWGYLNKPINDPYLASWSNKYTKGKYVRDGVYDPESVSEQPGALTILKVLLTVDPTIVIDGATGTISQRPPVLTADPGAPSTPRPPPAPTRPPVSLPAIDFKTLLPLVDQVLPYVIGLIPGASAVEAQLMKLAHDMLNAVPGTSEHARLYMLVNDGLPVLAAFVPAAAPFLPIISGLANLLLSVVP